MCVCVCGRERLRGKGRPESKRIESSERKEERLHQSVIVTTDGTFRIKRFHHAVPH